MTISRRTFTSSGVAALMTAALPKLSLAAARPHSVGSIESSLATGWNVFTDGKLAESNVTVPNTPIALSWHRWEPATWEKVWTYRRTFDIAASSLQKRLFLHIDRALANASVTINGNRIASHEGGFLPFECEITQAVHSGSNDLEIEVDSRWLNIPPSGSPKGFSSVDYYLPGGITGAVTLIERPFIALTDVWTRTENILDAPKVHIVAQLDATTSTQGELLAELHYGDNHIAQTKHAVALTPGRQTIEFQMKSVPHLSLWSPDTPHRYQLTVSFITNGRRLHSHTITTGFREARFELDGFYLNGKKTRLFGLNRHELFPYVGFAASPRAHRHDAEYLRNTLNCNIVRCSHYPQSTAFLDACDELGLMVWEEIPGWQYLGDAAWKDIAVRNVEEMIRRDRNHPSIIVWGTRVNESANDPELYRRTRELALQLDPTRPTSGSMTPSSQRDWKEHWHEDIFAFDDYHAAPDGTVGIDAALPGVPYMLAEAVGQYSYGTAKDFLRRYRRAGIPEEQNAQAVLHAQAHDRAAQDSRNAGVIAWCGFDYASPMNAYEGVKCPGVIDSFRIPKLGASFYRSQVDVKKRVVLEPSFYWDATLHAKRGKAAIFSNCDELRIYLNDTQHAILQPDRQSYPTLLYPPFILDLPWDAASHSILRIDGYANGKRCTTRSFDGSHEHDQLWGTADDTHITSDGVDTTRIAFGVADRFGNTRPIADGIIRVQHSGPGQLVGDQEFTLSETGTVGAVWLRSIQKHTGQSEITLSHNTLGRKSVQISIV